MDEDAWGSPLVRKHRHGHARRRLALHRTVRVGVGEVLVRVGVGDVLVRVGVGDVLVRVGVGEVLVRVGERL